MRIKLAVPIMPTFAAHYINCITSLEMNWWKKPAEEAGLVIKLPFVNHKDWLVVWAAPTFLVGVTDILPNSFGDKGNKRMKKL